MIVDSGDTWQKNCPRNSSPHLGIRHPARSVAPPRLCAEFNAQIFATLLCCEDLSDLAAANTAKMGVAAAPLLLLVMSASSAAAPMIATPSDDFVDSIGINTHLTYTDTNYANSTKVGEILLDIGVRYVKW